MRPDPSPATPRAACSSVSRPASDGVAGLSPSDGLPLSMRQTGLGEPITQPQNMIVESFHSNRPLGAAVVALDGSGGFVAVYQPHHAVVARLRGEPDLGHDMAECMRIYSQAGAFADHLADLQSESAAIL